MSPQVDFMQTGNPVPKGLRVQYSSEVQIYVRPPPLQLQTGERSLASRAAQS